MIMERYKNNIIISKSIDFAVRIAKLYRYLTETKHEYVMSKQLLRSGTSIGANAFEAVDGQSRSDFLAKMNISLKETNETMYWVVVLYKAEYLSESEYISINEDVVELKKILTSIVKKTKQDISENKK